jgi:hypothetical protein
MMEKPSLSIGAALGLAIAGYRDGNTLRCAEGLVEAVQVLRQTEEALSFAEQERDAAQAAIVLLQHRITELERER